MFILIIFAVLFLWLGVAIFLDRTSSYNSYEFGIGFATVLIVIFGLYIGISSMAVYNNQVVDIEKLAVIDERIAVHEENLERIRTDLEIYGELNTKTVTELFKDFSHGDASNIDAKAYPDIPIQELNMYITEIITTLHNRITERKDEAIYLQRRIDTRLRYKHTLVFFLPTE